MLSVTPLHFPFIQQIQWKQYHPSFCSFCSNCQTQTATNHHHYNRENESTQDQQQGEKYSEPIQYLRWSFSQKQFTAFRNYWFLKSSFLDVWLGSKGASDKLIITFFYSMTQSKFFYFICGAIFLLNRLLAQKISFE